jgi:hypothetical protein
MWTLAVVEVNPVADHAADVLLQCLTAMPMCALLFECFNDLFDHAQAIRKNGTFSIRNNEQNGCEDFF